MREVVAKILDMEQLGITVYPLCLDIGDKDAHRQLKAELRRLSLPPVLGVVHAAGLLEGQLLTETTGEMLENALRPKVDGTLALHKAFPPGTIDFLVLFSSIGHIIGASGESAYGSANAFLDTFASYRRSLGDNTVSFQWSAWAGLGMAISSDFIAMEFESKGVSMITAEEAFQAWVHVGKYDISHCTVGGALPIDEGQEPLCPAMEEITPRRMSAATDTLKSTASEGSERPSSGEDLRAWLNETIRQCLAAVLTIEDVDDIDPRAAVVDIGLDSVMTVPLRKRLQDDVGIKVPSTLIWNYPTIAHLVEWFYVKISEEEN
jgi:6-methylsalicylic acid synthase